MTLRLRLTLVAAGVVAIVVAAASVTVYFVMRHDLYKQVDDTIGTHAALLQHDPRAAFRGFDEYANDVVVFVDHTGQPLNGAQFPVSSKVKAVASGKVGSPFFGNTVIRGIHVREAVAPLSGGAVMVARNVDPLENDLHRLRLILILVSAGGVLAALGAR